jgi:pyruvate/2-oxoglutarate/acetoin dehydrogenase E1 component
VELYMVDFVAVALDALLNHAAKLPALSGGTWPVPMVLRAPTGAGYGDGGQHGQALWGLLGGIPGLQVVVPSTPADGAGAMLAAIASEHPVVVMEPKLLTDTLLEWLAGSRRGTIELDVPPTGHDGPVPEPPEPLQVGAAAWRRHGGDVSLVSLGVGVHRCLQAAEVLAERGVEAGVLDLRWVAPLDTAALLAAADAGAVVVVDEDVTRGGLSGEIAGRLLEHGVHVPFARVTTEGVLPYARERERRALPNVERIVTATADLVAG